MIKIGYKGEDPETMYKMLSDLRKLDEPVRIYVDMSKEGDSWVSLMTQFEYAGVCTLTDVHKEAASIYQRLVLPASSDYDVIVVMFI